MLAALIVLFREGLESALIISVFAAALRRQGARREMARMWAGVAAALVITSLATFLIIMASWTLSGRGEELFEGSLMAVTAAVLTYMIWWMRTQGRALRGEVEARLTTALAAGSGMALVALVFISVLREGLEAGLYLGTLFQTQPMTETTAGALAGLGLAAVLGLLLYKGSHRIPLSRFFDVTTIVLIFFAAGMVGKATLAFQAAGVFPGTIAAWDTSAWLRETGGIGQMLSPLLGYTATPSVLQVIFYFTYLALVGYLFLGIGPGEARGRVQETFVPIGSNYATRRLYRLLRRPWFPRAMAWGMVGLLAFLLAVGLFNIAVGPFSGQGMMAWGPFSNLENKDSLFNFAVWIVWMPLLSITAVLFGRFWCGNLCPLRVLTEGARSLADRFTRRAPPVSPYLRIGWLLPTSFILITFFVKLFPVQTEPVLGAITFLAIAGVAVGVGFLFRRGTWCRFICPIGGWLARAARLSVLGLRPQHEVCATCVEKPCLTGPAASRCPVYLNPSALDSSRHCLECWACIKSCPPQKSSLKLGYRPPAAELAVPHTPDLWEALYVSSLIGMYIAVAGQGYLFAGVPWGWTFLGLIAFTSAAYLVLCLLAARLGGMEFLTAVKTLGYIALPLEFAWAILTFGDDALGFLGIMTPMAGLFLGLGFLWSVLLGASILRNQARGVRGALLAAVPVGAALITLLFLGSKWFLAGVVIDVT